MKLEGGCGGGVVVELCGGAGGGGGGVWLQHGANNGRVCEVVCVVISCRLQY